jgi:hypothetical protein
MKTFLLSSIGFFAQLIAAAAAPEPTQAPDMRGGCNGYDCDPEYVVTRVSKVHQKCPQVKTKTFRQCTKTVVRPEYHTVTAYKTCPKQPCGGGCHEHHAPATVTVYSQFPPYTIPYPVTSTIFNNLGGAVTITVAAATVTVTTTTTTSVNGAPAAANTQPVKNGGFVAGLTSWTSTTSNGATINGSRTMGLIDFTNSTVNANAGLDSADIEIPTNVTSAAANPIVVLSQNVTLTPSSNYVLSFFVNLGQNLQALANIPALSGVLGSLLNTTNLAGVASTIPLAALAQCQVGTMVQTTAGSTYVHVFPFAIVQNGAVTPLLSVGVNGTAWTRLDTYFTTTATDTNAVLSFTFQCPGLTGVVAPSVLGALTTILPGLTGLLGNLLSLEGATRIGISLDQVTLDYYSNP